MLRNLLLFSESYTYKNWAFKDINVEFSRLYYIIDGEAYYEENGKKIQFKKNHLYLTPVRTPFSLSENPANKLLHTYAHIVTLPAADRFFEIEVKTNTPLADAVALWRKYTPTQDAELVCGVIQLVLSYINKQYQQANKVVTRTKQYIDKLEDFTFDMANMSRAIGYSREHITRSFFAALHVTPKQYFHIHRMNAGLQKLQEGATVKEVADLLNYSSPYAYSKAFKKHFGLSPRNYLLALAGSD